MVARALQARLRLIATGDRPGHPKFSTCVDGPFLGQLTSLPRNLDATRNLRPGATAPQLFLQLFAEPTFRALLWHDVTVDELIDDSGRQLEQMAFDRTPLAFSRGCAQALFRLAPRPDASRRSS